MKKLDKSKVKWIISQKQKKTTTNEISQTMGISAIWVKKLWVRYRQHRISYTNDSCRRQTSSDNRASWKDFMGRYSASWPEFVNSATDKEKLCFKKKIIKQIGTKIRQGFTITAQDESIFIADAIVRKKMGGQKGNKTNSHY